MDRGGGVLQGNLQTWRATKPKIKSLFSVIKPIPVLLQDTAITVQPRWEILIDPARYSSSMLASEPSFFTCVSVRYSVVLFILRCRCMFWMGNEWILLGQLGHSENPRWGWCHHVSCWQSGTRQTEVERLFQNAPKCKWETQHITPETC